VVGEHSISINIRAKRNAEQKNEKVNKRMEGTRNKRSEEKP